ncbi:hypothetical protein FT663_03559 [Candidozyma haemuli var. vulneris]|uniref:Uncharacterized protein n=1 Tax=Candidozyma haemuli TaxID=45357 RepID=A0A2V1B115_9ASCO|nr:hypothetical protein CXQ85_003128 [[Candida] haemuloni]KAF3988596.1 hypothetical protein FT662_03341 [[Candida] haemuloni var. vulneris]KAF3989615.1 hypothetical protein FT663_03559 [[Candida] haemuloni var. vulneris]PVH23393.1 hypothetical protein CXQ85_003128 [[Candida] haemuloni]
MVAISHIINNGLLLTSQSVFQDVATPHQAATEQYNLVKYLAGAGPYIQHPGFGISKDVPEQCTVEQVHLLSRHGERYPSKGKGKQFEELYAKFKGYDKPFVGELAFLNDYEYFVSDKEYYEKETSPKNSQGLYAGTSDAFNHGTTFRSRYSELFEQSSEPLTLFTSNSGRCHVTARYFARGLFGDEYSDDTADFAVIAEEDKFGANSLTPVVSCQNFHYSASKDFVGAYNTDFLSATSARITEGNDFNLTEKETSRLVEWCAYEINVRGYSPFCNLFTNDEFVKLSYGSDLSYYYGNGPGNNLTGTIGAPYLQATLDYLKEDNPPQKFVLAFTHDTNIEHFHAALGLLAPEDPLPNDHIPFPVPYAHTQIVPMGARLYTEKYKCGGESYVRFLVNDAVVPLQHCQDGPGFSCKLSDYEAYVQSRLEGKDYASQCGAENVPEKVTFLWDYKTQNYSAPDIDS